jgi:nardilysin
MGSKKYPKENEFDQFIKSRNGFDNAMTECEFTIFYFKIDEEHLAGALDRFSQFFIAPLMQQESMKREMQAVESEFQNEVNNDVYRINQIFASMVRDDHPASYFTWGNLKTLKTGVRSDDLHQIVHAFFRRFYKSNRMSLSIQSNLNLDEQQKLVEKYFSDIAFEYGTIWKKTSVDPFVDVFKPDFYKKMFYVKSKTKKRKLFLTFLLPTVENDYKNRSLDYLAFLFNNEGRESLNSFFRKRSLAFNVSAKIGSRNFEGNSMFTFFTIEVSLTRDGYENMGSVIDAVFGYLFIIKITPIEEHKEIYDEFKEMQNTFAKYRKEKSQSIMFWSLRSTCGTLMTKI